MNDFDSILKKAKELENQMKESKDKIKKINAEGVSVDDHVKVILNGDGEIIKLDLSPDVLNEDKNVIEDLIIAAHNNAKVSLKNKTAEEISKATSGLGIPGFKWPF